MPEVSQLRLVVEAEDFDEAVSFSRDAMSLEVEFGVARDRGAESVAVRVCAEDAPGTCVGAGAELSAPPTENSGLSLNPRREAPARLQITLFEERDG